ncbi:TetR/AcrR family transcriptional regulator [Phaeobacter gallaeciensis]|uniref:TetR/AcrR family transcriptional regulator n=1 Tax=Phaeobacter gallaeciensis TaxID=60890 RepID=UPI000BC0ACFE|nr:TetR/AcrR family transcriptional regulator [Phaeobacter gallaeciensis]ATF20691.1 transcriptional regulator, TetR family [Phaeobacter gallaeciensis]ATF24800.1 transcriptional regulator, TetR family [Phaeobacter gallaeciensis]
MTGDVTKQGATPRRGRPALSEDALQQRREEITTVALHLFIQEGFASVSMRRLGKEVGLTPMALYRYFPSKMEILSTIWAHILGAAFKEVDSAATGAQTSVDRLRSASHSYVDYWFRNIDHYHLVFMSSGVSKKDVTSFVSRESLIDAYEIFFDTVASGLELPRCHERVKIATDGLICQLHGIMHSLITMQGVEWTPRGQLVDLAVDSVAGHIDR